MPRIPITPRSDVGARLATLRKEKGLTQKQLAAAIGTAHQNIAYWERQASTPRGDVLPKLAEILEVSVDEILGVKKRKASNPRGRMQRVFDNVSKLPRRQQQRILGVVEDMISGQSVNS